MSPIIISQVSSYITIARDWATFNKVSPIIISQASSYITNARYWAITSARDNQDDCQTTASHNIKPAPNYETDSRGREVATRMHEPPTT